MESILKNKKIILGVTGSIAAYKSPLLVRELIKAGAHVSVVMTPSAKEFVTPITLANVSKNPVVCEMFDEQTQNGGAWHIQLAHWADAMMIVPCSATTMGKLANGIADNSLVTVAIALPPQVPLIISPAMDSTMYMHPSTQRNAEILRSYGARIIQPESGDLASGLVGPGRMPEISVIIDELIRTLEKKNTEPRVETHTQVFTDKEIRQAAEKSSRPLASAVEHDQFTAELELELMKAAARSGKMLHNKRVIITAGPTVERIDDVRFISNMSSGKMGYALAEAASRAGALVTLVSGPVCLPTPPSVELVRVESAAQMYEAVMTRFAQTDIAIFAAAVADYAPKEAFKGKIKKAETGSAMTIELVSTRDILATAGKMKKPKQIVIGFALESSNELENAKKKLTEKNCDMIVLNSANKDRSGFGGDDNTVTLVYADAPAVPYPPMAKKTCAELIIGKIAEMV